MPRPTKQPGEKRSATIRARLTVAEKLYAEEQARAAGLTLTDFVRRRVLGIPVKPRPHQLEASLITELNRIGVNLNQIARAANAGRDLPGSLDAERRALQAALIKVMEAYDS